MYDTGLYIFLPVESRQDVDCNDVEVKAFEHPRAVLRPFEVGSNHAVLVKLFLLIIFLIIYNALQ